MIKALIFDMDGTLLDTMSAWDNIGYEYLSSKGITAIPEKLDDELKAMTLLEASELFRKHFLPNNTKEQICDDLNNLIRHKYEYEFELKENTKEFLEMYKHLPKCVATATERSLVEPALKRLGIFDYFEFIITSYEVGNSKTEPDIFLQSAEKLGHKISETIVFEDAPFALKTAKTAGFYTVAIHDDSYKASIDIIKEYSDQYVNVITEFIMPEGESK